MEDENEKRTTSVPDATSKPSTRQQFLGAAIVAGGAVYLDPISAAAAPMGPAGAALSTTPIAKLVQVGGALPGNITPHDLALLASLQPGDTQQVARMYPDLRFGQLRTIIDAVIKSQGADARVFQGSGGKVAMACCCCSCCCKININKAR